MADYKQMYITMFQSVTKAIELLQKAQSDAEEIYIAAENFKATVLGKRQETGETEPDSEPEPEC